MLQIKRIMRVLLLVFTSDVSASNRDDPSENEIRRKQVQAKSSEHFELFRREVIWIQYFHWTNISMSGKYRCASVMLELYIFGFTCCSTNASISVSTRKRKKI